MSFVIGYFATTDFLIFRKQISMSSTSFLKKWNRLRNQILKSQISKPKKILAYKVFLRPMLLYRWFTSSKRLLKSLEVQALKDIFGKRNEKFLYEKFSDCNIENYQRIEEIRWKRRTKMSPQSAQNMLTRALPEDSTSYFTRSLERKRHRRRVVGVSCQSPNSEIESESTSSRTRIRDCETEICNHKHDPPYSEATSTSMSGDRIRDSESDISNHDQYFRCNDCLTRLCFQHACNSSYFESSESDDEFPT